jgi:hypothetical protein
VRRECRKPTAAEWESVTTRRPVVRKRPTPSKEQVANWNHKKKTRQEEVEPSMTTMLLNDDRGEGRG